MKHTFLIPALILSVVLASLALADGDAPKPETQAKADHAEKEAHVSKEKPGQDKPEGKFPGLWGEYRMMAAVVDLDETQIEKMAALAKEQGKAREEFRAQMKKDRQELADKIQAARAGGDKTKLAELAEQKKDLYAREKAFRDSQAAARMAILTDEQKAAWRDFEVYRTLTRLLRKAKLTEEQKTQLRGLVKGKGEEVASSADDKARKAAVRKLRDQAVESILTDEQKEALNARPRKDKEGKSAEGAKEKKDRPSPEEKSSRKGKPEASDEGGVSAEG